jgi:hypothetical protein
MPSPNMKLHQTSGYRELHSVDPAPSCAVAAVEKSRAPATIFHAPWWLDVVTAQQWGMVESRHQGNIVGRMPVYYERRGVITSSRMPMLTHFLGPVIEPSSGSRNTRFLHEVAVTRDLIRQLPKLHSFSQKMHRGVTDVIAFQMENFETSAQFTFEIKPAPADVIWKNMRDKTRNVMRQADKIYSVHHDMDGDEFVALYEAHNEARGRSSDLEPHRLKKIINETLARNSGRIYFVRNQARECKAAIFCIWDQQSCYYLLSTRAVDSGNGAVTRLLWEAIQNAAAQQRIFDFDGLAYGGAVVFYAGFGGEISPRFIVSRSTSTYRLMRETRRCLGVKANPYCI